MLHYVIVKTIVLVGLKHFPNVEPRFYCPQAFLSLDFQCKDEISELKQTEKSTWRRTSQAAVERQDLCCTYLAHHELERTELSLLCLVVDSE